MKHTSEPRSLNFKERMSGHVVFNDLDDLVTVNDDGTGWACLKLEMHMHIDDVDAFWSGDRIGTATGTVKCEGLGGSLPIHDGHFQLMVAEVKDGDMHMTYLIEFEDVKGRHLTLHGYKDVVPGGFGPWEDTTTTLCRIQHDWITDFRKWQPDAAGSGVLRIRLRDFIWQEFTFRANPDAPRATRIRTRFTFPERFLNALWQNYRPGARRPAGPEE